MFERLMSIFKSMFNKGMAKMETPEVLAEQAEMELESNFKKISESLTSSMANEKMLEQKVKKAQEDLALWEKRAMQAVQQNNDDMARQCLAKKQETAQSLESLESQLAEQKRSVAMTKERFNEIQQKLKEFRSKKNEILARAKASDSITEANKLLGGTGSTGLSSMDKLEKKIAEKEAMSQAVREMSGISKVDDEFKEWDKKAGLDDELARLKANVSGASGPRLIEAKEPAAAATNHTQVDANLPMIVDVEEVRSTEDEKK